MSLESLVSDLKSARAGLLPDSGALATADRLLQLLTGLRDKCAASDFPPRVASKAEQFLASLCELHSKLGPKIAHRSFALNSVGEAMVRSDFLHGEVIEFLQVGLYFFGLDQIERRWPAQAAIYSGIHADHLESFLSRHGLLDLVRDGQERIQQGRVFCLTYAYLNGLRRAYWGYCRGSEDALDISVVASTDDPAAEMAAPSRSDSAPLHDRIALLLRIFRRALTAEQRWIYLAKNRRFLDQAAANAEDIEGLVAEIGAIPEQGELGWTEIASSLHINEKTAKREYLRALHVLLKESSEAVFGTDQVSSRFVKRVLSSIREVVQEKDLRLKSQTGRGLHVLVEKWEVALRFVLNHERISA